MENENLNSNVYYSETLGFYRPTMFHIKVCRDVNLKDMKSWDDVCISAFFHEYIHFLQDIMTAFGLYNIFVNGEYIAYACNYIYKLPKGGFGLPISINPGPQYIYENQQIAKLTKAWKKKLPNGADGPMHINSKAMPTPRNVTLWDKKISIDEYKVSSLEGQFTVGGFHIMESMAYLAQKAVYPVKMPYTSPDYPYNVVEQIGNKYKLSFADKHLYYLFLFGLCHIALMTSHPIKTITNLFEKAENDSVNDSNWRHFVEESYKNTFVVDPSNKTMSIIDGLTAIKDYALVNLDKQFGTCNHKQVRDWYHNAIETMCALWRKNPMILIEMLEAGDPRNNALFFSIIDGIGTPLLTNTKDVAYIYSPKKINISVKKHARLLAAGGIISLFENREKECILKNICAVNLGCSNNNCSATPWRNAKMINPCPFGHLWYGWNLKNWFPL